MEPLTEEQQADVNERVAQFRERYLASVEELQVDFVVFPQFQQNQDGTFNVVATTTLADKKYLPIKSPFTK